MSPTTSDRPVLAGRAALRRRRAALLVPVIALAVLAAGCGSSDDLSGTVVKDALGCQPSEVDRRTDVPEVKPGTEVGKKVATTDEKKGKGCAASAEGYLSLDLVGATAADGKSFADTFATAHPITAQLGQNQLVAGLETGLAGMKVGGRRTIKVPTAQGYGKDGNPAQHIGKADLVFVVDLLGVTTAPLYCSDITDLPKEKDGKPIEGKPTDIKMPVKVPTTKVISKDLKVGTGRAIGKSAYVTVRYYGISCLNGRQFDSSWDRGIDDTLKVALGGAAQSGDYSPVIPGWSSGLLGAKVGGLRQLAIPYQLAYGAQGQGADIGPYASLVFVIEVLDVKTKAPKVPKTTTTTTTAPASSTTAAGATTTSAGAGGSTTTTGGATSTTGGATTTTTAASTTTTTTK